VNNKHQIREYGDAERPQVIVSTITAKRTVLKHKVWHKENDQCLNNTNISPPIENKSIVGQIPLATEVYVWDEFLEFLSIDLINWKYVLLYQCKCTNGICSKHHVK